MHPPGLAGSECSAKVHLGLAQHGGCGFPSPSWRYCSFVQATRVLFHPSSHQCAACPLVRLFPEHLELWLIVQNGWGSAQSAKKCISMEAQLVKECGVSRGRGLVPGQVMAAMVWAGDYGCHQRWP